MRRFRFPLQRLHRFRAHQERMAHRVLAQELSALHQAEERMQQVEDNLSACQEQSREEGMRSLTQALQRGLQESRRLCESKIATAEQRVEQARDGFNDSRKNLKSLTNLRERRWEAWMQEMESETQSEFDEMARLRFQQRRREEI